MNKNILIIGKSNKFIKITAELFGDECLEILPWRMCSVALNHKEFGTKKFDLIIVCGYDYTSNLYAFEAYYKCNVELPFTIVTKLMNNNRDAKIIYIHTLSSNKKYTYSRYYYAKNELAMKLSKNYSNCMVLRAPSIVNECQKLDIYAGPITKSIFNLMKDFNILKTTTISELKNQIIEKLNNKELQSYEKTVPRLLNIRRNIFTDRMCRLLFG